MMPPQSSVAVPQRRSLEHISIGALLVTLVAALFIVVPSSAVPLITTKTYLLAAGALVTSVLYILARLSRGNIIFPPLLLVGALWLPVIATVLSALFSGASFTSALWGLSLENGTLGLVAVVTCLGTLTALLLRRPEHYRLFLSVGAWVFGVLTVLQVGTILVGQIWPSRLSPAFSFVGSMNDLAFLLGLGVVSALIAFRFTTLSQKASRALWVSSVLALLLLAVANSQLVWTLVALGALGFFVEAVMRRGAKNADADLDDSAFVDEPVLEAGEGSHSLVLPLLTLVVSLFFLIGGTLGGALASALKVNVLNVRPSWQSTLSVAHKTYAAAPVFGTGPNTFGVEWLKYRDASLNSTVFWNVRFLSGVGFIPTELVTNGAIGALAWLLFIAGFIGIGVRVLIRRAPEDAAVRAVSILSFVAVLYLLAIAIFDSPSALVLALLFVFAGLFVSTTRYAAGGQQWGIIFSRSPRIGFVIVFTLTLVLLSLVVAGYALVEHYIATAQLSRAQVAFSSGNLDDADATLQKSIAFSQSAVAYQAQAAIASARLGRIVTSTTLSKAEAQQAYQKALSAGINAALTATNLNPSDSQGWMALGNLYAQAVPLGVSGAYDSAKTAYGKAGALDPTNPQVFYTLAQLEVSNRNLAAAKTNLQSAIALKQDYTDAIFLLSQIEVQDGHVKEALDAALAAAYFTPNNPSILFQIGILSAAQGNFSAAESALVAAVAANSQFANARYFLAAVYEKEGNTADALAQLKAVGAMSEANAAAVAPMISALEEGKNPFPANLLSISPAPVK